MLHLARYSSVTPADFEKALGITVGFDSMFDRLSVIFSGQKQHQVTHRTIFARTKKKSTPLRWLLQDFLRKTWKLNSKKVY